MVTRLRGLVLIVRNIDTATQFYTQGLNLAVISQDGSSTELQAGPAVTISIQAVEGNEAAMSTGYSPFMNFDIADMDATIPTLIQLGGRLDGPIQYPPHGKVASIRSPDGHMVGLFEPS
eukprot:m.275186 g.275186  ORF g.275186 m.275186 type:complete len:119 (-) comp116743_c0_seq1:264-620(-)